MRKGHCELGILKCEPVTRVAEHLIIVFRDGATGQHLLAVTAGEAQLVVDVPQPLHLLREIHILVTARTNTRHCQGFYLKIYKFNKQ